MLWPISWRRSFSPKNALPDNHAPVRTLLWESSIEGFHVTSRWGKPTMRAQFDSKKICLRHVIAMGVRVVSVIIERLWRKWAVSRENISMEGIIKKCWFFQVKRLDLIIENFGEKIRWKLRTFCEDQRELFAAPTSPVINRNNIYSQKCQQFPVPPN